MEMKMKHGLLAMILSASVGLAGMVASHDVQAAPTKGAKKDDKKDEKKAEPGKGPLADMHYGRVHTFPVRFAPGQIRTVRHTYRHATSLTSPWCSDLTYILKTGALWAVFAKLLY